MATAQVGLLAAVAGVGLLVAGMATLIFDVVVDRTAALADGGGVAVLAVVLLAVVPQLLSRE